MRWERIWGRLHECHAKKSKDRTTANREGKCHFLSACMLGPSNRQLNSSWARPSEYWFPTCVSRDRLGGAQSVDGKTYYHLESRAKNKINKLKVRLSFLAFHLSSVWCIWNIIKSKIKNVRDLHPVILLHLFLWFQMRTKIVPAIHAFMGNGSNE